MVNHLAKKKPKGWQAYEKKTAEAHRGKHVGGPAKEDYKRGNKKGEVKFRKNKVTKPELQGMFKKGISEVESVAGFTIPAIEYKTRYHKKKKLFQQGKEVM